MMTIGTIAGGTLLLFMLAACDTGPYDPSAHRHADASTGSRLSGVDTGIDDGTNGGNGDVNNNPAIRTNGGGAAAYHGR